MEPVHLGVTTHGATLTHALVMLRRHNPRTLLVHPTPTPTQLAALWMNLLQQLLEDQSLPRVKQESMVAHAMIRDWEMTAGTGLNAQVVLALVGPTQRCPVGHTVCRPPYPERWRRIHQHTEPCAGNISSREVLHASIKLPTWSWQMQTVQLGVTTNGAMWILAIVTVP